MRQVNHFKLGLAIVVSVVLLISVVIWLGASRYFEKYRLVVTYLDESVQGLDRGSPVRYRGVTIGSVETIRVAPDGKLIEIVMKVNPDAPIDFKSMRASLVNAGITGLKFVNIDFPSSPKLAQPAPLSFEAPYPVIPSEPSGLKTIMDSLQNAYQKFMDLDIQGVAERLKVSLENVNNIMANLKIDKIMENVEKTTQGTATLLTAQRVDRIMNNVEKIAENMEKTTQGTSVLLNPERVDRIMADIEKTTTNIAKISEVLQVLLNSPETKDTLHHVQQITAHVEGITDFVEKQTSKQLMERTLEQLIATLEETRKTVVDFRQDFRNIEYGFRKTAANAEATLRSVKQLADYLERDPSSLLRGRSNQ